MRRRRDPEEKARLLARREELGLTWSELSADSGIPRSTLQLWGRNLRSAHARRKRSGFVRVSVVERSPAGSSERLEIVLRSGVRLIVPDGVDVEQLVRLIAALDRGC